MPCCRLPSAALFAYLLLRCWTPVADAATVRLNVAADGSAEFRSIQEAIDAVPSDPGTRAVISIRDGQYCERIRLDKSNVTLRGESRDGTRIHYYFPREAYHRRYDRFGPGVVNLFGDDLVIEHLTIENTQPNDEHAFAVYGQPNRLILNDCNILGEGGDTLSLWNTSFGMYYHRNCKFRGGVDFVCPRGWCFVRDSQFESVGRSAAIWHDGHLDPDMKFVIRESRFDGPRDFWIGRNHYPSQFYLLDCQFSENLADKPLLTVSEPKPGYDPAWWERKYFHNCHRSGGDYEWMKDNLHSAPGSPRPEEVTPEWTFAGRWNPERTDAPVVEQVETAGERLYVRFSEPVAGTSSAAIMRQDGTRATYVRGEGERLHVFSGGNADSLPAGFSFAEEPPYALTATLADRRMENTDLPPVKPLQTISLVLVGDSTVADYPPDRVEQGWGQALPLFFDEGVAVHNFARGGRSSKSFRSEGLWDEAMKTKADLVLIQFGHNDNPGKGPERETDPGEGGDFRQNLRNYVEQARAAGATPVLLSPPVRRVYVENGLIDPNCGNAPYAEATRAVAAELDCALVDLNELTRELFNRLEEAHSHWMQPPGDRTHFTPPGARRVAAMVVESLQEQIDTLGNYTRQDKLRRP